MKKNLFAVVFAFVLAALASMAQADTVTDTLSTEGAKVLGWISAMIVLGLGFWAGKMGGRKMGWWP